MVTILSTFFCILINAQSIPPQWMRTVPNNPNNSTYCFIRIEADASSRDMGRSKCFQLLALDQGLLNTLTISYISKDYITSTTQTQNGIFNEDLEQKSFEFITTEGKPIQVTAYPVDEFFSEKKQQMSILYQVAIVENAVFDKCTKTESYLNDPATWGLSIIPGAAQMHKGSYIKGGIIMGSSAALVGGIIAFENMRSDYMSKISQTHSADVKKTYNNEANNCETARNLCIGGLAALYIYNIIDAFIAPGARRIIVTPAVVDNGQPGLSASYTF